MQMIKWLQDTIDISAILSSHLSGHAINMWIFVYDSGPDEHSAIGFLASAYFNVSRRRIFWQLGHDAEFSSKVFEKYFIRSALNFVDLV